MIARLGELPALGRARHHARGDASTARVLGLRGADRDRLLRAALAPRVDPDELLRAFRRAVVPLGADRGAGDADGAGARARRAAPRATRSAAGRASRPRGSALAARGHRGGAGPRDRRRGDARGARLRRRRARRPRRRAAVVAARPRVRAPRRSRSPRSAIAAASAGWERVRGLPARCVAPLERRRAGRSPAALVVVRAAAVRRPPGDRPMSALVARPASRTRIRARRGRRWPTSRCASSRASSSCSPAARARASRRCCAPPPASCRTSTAATFAGRLRGGRARHARARPGRARRGRRHAVPGPRDAGRDGHGARRARVPAREPRLGRGGGGARGRGGGARARDRRRCSTARRTSCRGGELQRVALGAALAGRPRLLLLDEPTSQLDPVAGDELLGVLRRLNEEWGTAVVLAEHRLERCLPAADRVIALDDGARAFDADARGVPRVGARPRCRRRARACSRSPACAAAGRREGRARRAARARLARPATRRRPSDPRLPAPRGSCAAAAGAAVRARAASASGSRSRAGRRSCAASTSRVGAGRDGRADGPQRRGQVDAAAARCRARPSRRAAGSSAAGRVALLLQNPGDYFLHERVREELPPTRSRRRASASWPTATRATSPAASASGSRSSSCSTGRASRGRLPRRADPRHGPRPQATRSPRGCASSPRRAAAVLVATHDAEFAAALGRPHGPARRRRARSPTRRRAEVLGGGWYFATQTARVLGGGALLPGGRRGAAAAPPRSPRSAGGAVSWVARLARCVLGARAGGRASPGTSGRIRPRACSRWSPRWPRSPRSAGSRSRRSRTSSRRPTSCCSPATCSAARPASRSARSPRWPRTSSSARARGRRGRWSPGAASGSAARCSARAAGRELGRVPLAVACGARRRWPTARCMNLHLWVTYSRRPHGAPSSARYFATSLPFDIAHVGRQRRCSASPFGPALVRALRRFRTRFEVTWLPAPARRGVAARRGRARAPPRRAPADAAARRAVAALARAPRTPTAAAAARPASARRSSTPAGRRSASPPPGATRATSSTAARLVDYMRAHPRELDDLGELKRTILVLRAAGVPPQLGGATSSRELARQAAHERLVRRPREHDRVRDPRPARRRPLAAATARSARAARWIARQANSDGGFNFAGRGGAVGDRRHRRGAAGARRRRAQRGTTDRPPRRALPRPPARTPTAASRCSPAARSNAQSTAWAVQALLAGRPRPRRRAATARATRSPTCAR